MNYKPFQFSVATLLILLAGCSSGGPEFTQPQLSARSLDVLTVGGYEFKDHNKNATVDPYEDWRLPVEERVVDLLDQMTVEEKAGLMAHPALNMGENGTLFEPVPGEEDKRPPGMPRFPQPGTSEVILQKQINHVLVRFDLSGALLGTAKSPRDHMIYYRDRKIFAARSGPYKAHFITRNGYAFRTPEEAHDPPLLYHLLDDVSERFDIAKDHPEVVERIEKLVEAHKQTVKPVENQYLKGKNPNPRRMPPPAQPSRGPK